jgi:hypothetical protein
MKRKQMGAFGLLDRCNAGNAEVETCIQHRLHENDEPASSAMEHKNALSAGCIKWRKKRLAFNAKRKKKHAFNCRCLSTMEKNVHSMPTNCAKRRKNDWL